MRSLAILFLLFSIPGAPAVATEKCSAQIFQPGEISGYGATKLLSRPAAHETRAIITRITKFSVKSHYGSASCTPKLESCHGTDAEWNYTLNRDRDGFGRDRGMSGSARRQVDFRDDRDGKFWVYEEHSCSWGVSLEPLCNHVCSVLVYDQGPG